MRIGSAVAFSLAVLLSLTAATYRWGDSSHAMGLLTKNGGKIRHPSYLKSGWDRYAQITTVTVLPPYHGDVRVHLEGQPALDADIRFAGPVVNFGFRRRPEFKDGILYDVQPRDRLAFWVLMRAQPTDPVCGMSVSSADISHTFQGEQYHFCAQGCLASFRDDPERYIANKPPHGTYKLAFYDTNTGQPVLKVPFVFRGKEEPHASGRHH